MIHGHIGALLFLIKLKRKAAKNKNLNISSPTQSVQIFLSSTQSVSQDLVIFQEVPWNSVDMSLFFDALEINKEEAECLLSARYINDNGTFLVRLKDDEECERGRNNLILSFVYDGIIHHHKIILMKYFYRYSFCLQNGGINFHSVASLIKYHTHHLTLPLPCILKDEVKYIN